MVDFAAAAFFSKHKKGANSQLKGKIKSFLFVLLCYKSLFKNNKDKSDSYAIVSSLLREDRFLLSSLEHHFQIADDFSFATVFGSDDVREKQVRKLLIKELFLHHRSKSNRY